MISVCVKSLHYQLGVYYAEGRQEALALEAFSQALDINPGFTSIYKRMEDYGMTFPKTGTNNTGEAGSLDLMIKVSEKVPFFLSAA